MRRGRQTVTRADADGQTALLPNSYITVRVSECPLPVIDQSKSVAKFRHIRPRMSLRRRDEGAKIPRC